MKKPYLIVIAVLVASLTGCEHDQNPELTVAFENFASSTNYSSIVNIGSFTPYSSSIQGWTVLREGDEYWFERPYANEYVYRKENGNTHEQYSIDANFEDFTIDHFFPHDEYLFDINELDTQWFELSETEANTYIATDDSLDEYFKVNYDGSFLESQGISIDFNFTHFTIVLYPDQTIKSIHYQIEYEDGYGFVVGYFYENYGDTVVERPIGVDYPDLFPPVIDIQRNTSNWKSITVSKDDVDLYTLTNSQSTVMIDDLQVGTRQYVYRNPNHLENILIEFDDQNNIIDISDPISFRPLPFPMWNFTNSFDYTVIDTDPLQLVMNSDVVTDITEHFTQPESMFVNDLATSFSNVTLAWTDKDHFSYSFDRTSDAGTHHWEYAFDQSATEEVQVPFSMESFSLSYFLQAYNIQPQRHVIVRTRVSNSDLNYYYTQEDNKISIDVIGNIDSDYIYLNEPLADTVWLNDDGTLEYVSPYDPSQMVTIFQNNFNYPLNIADLDRIPFELFSDNIDHLGLYVLDAAYYDEILDYLAYDTLHKERPAVISAIYFWLNANRLTITVEGTMSNGYLVRFQQEHRVSWES